MPMCSEIAACDAEHKEEEEHRQKANMRRSPPGSNYHRVCGGGHTLPFLPAGSSVRGKEF